MAMATDQQLARFTDRHTMVYDRIYPHPIERVWEAVSTGQHLDVWMLPESRVERRLGGACAFGWGGPADDPNASKGKVTAFEPPTAIQYTFADGSFMRFDLAGHGAGDETRLLFTLHFLPGDPSPEDAYPGADKPAGPDTAWRPGFVAGYHGMLDDLAPFLRGEFTAADRAAHLAEGDDMDLIAVYREHIARQCPKT